jgi:hypothetical protein
LLSLLIDKKMTKHLRIYALLVLFCASCKGPGKTELPKNEIQAKTKGLIAADSLEITSRVDDRKPGDDKLTITRYSETESKGVIIQNSFPKGGPYIDPWTGRRFGKAVFWSRVINETSTPLEIAINFPADSFAIPPSADSYFKFFLLPDTMTFDKESLFDYGATGA